MCLRKQARIKEHAGGARGFKLDSLLKLTQTKSNDKNYCIGFFGRK